VIDATSLLSYSRLFLGGETMMIEAALLGIPSISFRALPTYADRYLMVRGLVFPTTDRRKVLEYADRVLNDAIYVKTLKAKSRSVMDGMEDPITVIEKHLDSA